MPKLIYQSCQRKNKKHKHKQRTRHPVEDGDEEHGAVGEGELREGLGGQVGARGVGPGEVLCVCLFVFVCWWGEGV